MIYFTLNEILLSLFAATLAGVLLGTMRRGSIRAFGAAINVFRKLPQIYRSKYVFSKSQKSGIKISAENCRGGFTKHAFDFLYTLISSVVFILIGYIYVDGIFRLYTLLALSLSFFASDMTLGKSIDNFMALPIKYAELFVLFSLKLVLYPFFAVMKGSFFVLKAFYRPVKKHKQCHTAKRLYKRKKQEICRIFEEFSLKC